MQTLIVSVPDALMREIEPYRNELAELLRRGLRQAKIEQALALYKQGEISIKWAAHLAGVSVLEMVEHAAAKGMQPTTDDGQTLRQRLS